MATTTIICTICLEPLIQQECSKVATVPCGHTCHEPCLKKWSSEHPHDDDTAMVCPYCNTAVESVINIFLSTKSGHDESLSAKELENWRKEYDAESQGQPLHPHAKELESNKKIIDDIFEKQKILETYESDRKALDSIKLDNYQLRKELVQQIRKHAADMRLIESNGLVFQEVLECNQKASQELKSMHAENLDLQRELLRNIMERQDDTKRLAASKQALSKALESHAAALNELKKSREDSLRLKEELVEHLSHHKLKMEQLQTHRESLQGIIRAHEHNVTQLELLHLGNVKFKEEIVNCIVQRKKDATKLANCEGWMEVLKEEVDSFDEDREKLRMIRTENYRLGSIMQERHKTWLQARRDLNSKVHEIALVKMNWMIAMVEIVFLGLGIHSSSLEWP